MNEGGIVAPVDFMRKPLPHLRNSIPHAEPKLTKYVDGLLSTNPMNNPTALRIM